MNNNAAAHVFALALHRQRFPTTADAAADSTRPSRARGSINCVIIISPWRSGRHRAHSNYLRARACGAHTTTKSRCLTIPFTHPPKPPTHSHPHTPLAKCSPRHANLLSARHRGVDARACIAWCSFKCAQRRCSGVCAHALKVNLIYSVSRRRISREQFSLRQSVVRTCKQRHNRRHTTACAR